MGEEHDKRPGDQAVDGDAQLTQEQALRALRVAAQRATESLPAAFAQCTTQEDCNKVQADRDSVALDYLNSLRKSLNHTSALYRRIAEDLEAEAEAVKEKAQVLQNVDQALGLLARLVRLSASLAMAFA